VALVSEADERLPAGPRGAQGERGERGLSRLQGRAVVILFLLAVLFGVSNWYWTAHEVNAASAAQRQEQAAQQRAAAVTQAAQRHQGEQIEMKLCTSFAQLASRPPPPGSPGDLSRQYLIWLHGKLVGLGSDIGCSRR
jgi:hypothetical protein